MLSIFTIAPGGVDETSAVPVAGAVRDRVGRTSVRGVCAVSMTDSTAGA